MGVKVIDSNIIRVKIWTQNHCSSHFGFYDEDDNVIPMHKRSIYRKDSIGLKTLEDQGKLKILTFPNVRHKEWHLNVDIINEAILPYLDW